MAGHTVKCVASSKMCRPTISSRPSPRREVLLSMVALTGFDQLPVHAKSFEDAQKEKEARKKKLREAAEVQKETGRGVDAFDQPEFSVSEEARNPEYRMRKSQGTQEQMGARK